ADNTPWQRALDGHDRCQFPALHHLAEALFAWKSVSECRSEAPADIEVAACVVGPEISRRVGRPCTFAGRLIKGMRKRKTHGVRKPMAGTLCQRDLCTVVIGKQWVRNGVDVRVIRIFAIQWS